MKKIYLLLLPLFIACHSISDKELNSALEASKENKKELLKVLSHYKDDPLKYKATIFLIKNMVNYKYTISNEVDSIKGLMSKIFRHWDLTEQELQKGLYWQKHIEYEIKSDIQEITSELLIENIDFSFKVWKEKSWNKNLSFDDFCELILPHRIAEEPLTKWRKKYYEKYNPILDSLYKGNDVIEACNILSDYIKKEKFFFINDFEIPRQGAEFHFNNRIGVCRDACDIAIYIMRSVGIPVTTDMYAVSPEYHSGHQWNVVRDTTNRYLPFLFDEYRANRNNVFIDKLKKGKVFRMTYKKNKSEKKLKYLYTPLTNPFLKDVTDEYFGSNKVEFYFEDNLDNENIFLGIFTARNGWFPIGKGKVENKKLIYENIEPFVVYQPLVYQNNKLIPIYYPFMYKKNKTHVFNLQKQIEKVKITRKYPLREHAKKFKVWVKGAEIRGSNNSDFSPYELLAKVDSLPLENVIYLDINSKKDYSYFQYKVDSVLSIAEIHFFEKNNKEILFDTIYSDGKPWKDIDLYQLKNCNDNNPLSFFHTWEKETSIFFETKSSKNVKKIKLIPRNDDNFISENDVYELFYNAGKKGWISLGQQKGNKEGVLYFDVPKNSILWLKNHTRGIEEQIFFMRDGEQIFISDL